MGDMRNGGQGSRTDIRHATLIPQFHLGHPDPVFHKMIYRGAIDGVLKKGPLTFILGDEVEGDGHVIDDKSKVDSISGTLTDDLDGGAADMRLQKFLDSFQTFHDRFGESRRGHFRNLGSETLWPPTRGNRSQIRWASARSAGEVERRILWGCQPPPRPIPIFYVIPRSLSRQVQERVRGKNPVFPDGVREGFTDLSLPDPLRGPQIRHYEGRGPGETGERRE